MPAMLVRSNLYQFGRRLLPVTTAACRSQATLLPILRRWKSDDANLSGAVPNFWGLNSRVNYPEEVRSPKDFRDMATRNWVSDAAGVLSDEQTAEINRVLTKLYRDLGIETGVVTLNEVTSVTDAQSQRMRMWCVDLFNAWGIGSPEHHNGLLIVLLRDQRRLETVTGLGLEQILPDSFLAEMQAEAMVPLLSNGLYGEAVLAGVRECDSYLRNVAIGVRWLGPPSDTLLLTDGGFSGGRSKALAPTKNSSSGSGSNNDRGKQDGGWRRGPFVAAGAVAGFSILQAAVGAANKKKCKKCGTPLSELSLAKAEAYLQDDKCFAVEKELGSVKYLYCPVCTEQAQWGPGGDLDKPGISNIVKAPKGMFEACPKCSCVCLQTRPGLTERPATQYSEGLRSVHKTCAYCNYSATETEYIPRLPKSSNGSDEGGQTYGGGASGGGGAGSSF